MPILPKTVERFESKFTRRNLEECWEWRASLTKGGYGQFGHSKKIFYAHRMSYLIYVGKIPNSLHVLHECDNRKCVNPNHLFLGTNLDNIKDKVSKGRQSAARGSKSGRAKLNESQVLEIRRRFWTNGTNKSNRRTLATEFGISVIQLNTIVSGKQWKHLNPE